MEKKKSKDVNGNKKKKKMVCEKKDKERNYFLDCRKWRKKEGKHMKNRNNIWKRKNFLDCRK